MQHFGVVAASPCTGEAEKKACEVQMRGGQLGPLTVHKCSAEKSHMIFLRGQCKHEVCTCQGSPCLG